MTATRRKILYVYGLLVLIGYPILMAYSLHRDPSAFLVGVVGGVLFFALYVIPFTLLQGRLPPGEFRSNGGISRSSIIPMW